MRLFHYTCTHCRARLGEAGILQPNEHPLLGDARLVWLTDMRVPDAQALGLTMHSLHCDRTAVRYVAHVPWALWWPAWRDAHQLLPDVVAAMEAGRAPDRWWVSEAPVPVRLSVRGPAVPRLAGWARP